MPYKEKKWQEMTNLNLGRLNTTNPAEFLNAMTPIALFAITKLAKKF